MLKSDVTGQKAQKQQVTINMRQTILYSGRHLSNSGSLGRGRQETAIIVASVLLLMSA